MCRRAGIMIALALIALTLLGTGSAQAGGGCHGEPFTDERTTTVKLLESCFTPVVVRIDAGQQVTWENPSSAAHTVTGVANTWGRYDELHMGDSVSYTFQKSGVFPYFCLLHPGMVAAVVVGDGRASTSANAGEGVSAVSAVVPGGSAGGASSPQQKQTNGGGGVNAPLVALIAIAAAGAGFAGGMLVRRRAVRPAG
ncbi:MAG: hypothetical protein Q7T33_08790 [Dehalococcoidia bacterium]|nr:hypothetical protein [Dehalococcoidia bacterium]